MKIPRAISAALDLAGRRIWELADGGSEIIHHRTSRPFQHFDPPLDPSTFAEMISARASEVHEEYIHRIKGDLLIDPRSGFVIKDRSTLVLGSLPNVEHAGRPSISSWAMARMGMASTLDLPGCISLRDVFETNYFHFFNDVLTRLPLLEEAGLLHLPIVVGHELYRTPFFQSVLPKLIRAGLEVVDQGQAYVHCKEIIYCKSIPFDRRRYDRILDLLEIAAPDKDQRGRRIFLTRGKDSRNQRTLSDQDEVHRMMLAHGIEIHDPASLTLEEQIELLSGTSQLIGLHGAGLANMIFRRGAPMQILEIFPADHVPPHYYWLSQMFGHEYRALITGRTDERGTFAIPPGQLERALVSLSSSARF